MLRSLVWSGWSAGSGPAAFATNLASQREPEQPGCRERKEPPGRDRVVREHPREDERERAPRGDAPVVSDDEPIPEAPERPQESHAPAPGGSMRIGGTSRRWARSSSATSPNDRTRTNASTTGIAASAPGHWTPAPSAAQKIPNVESIAPT